MGRSEVLLGMSVLTVTLNPSIDRTIALSSLNVGEINRAQEITLHPGGKGINVSRAARAFGVDTHALFIGGKLGESWMSGELDKAKIAHTVISFGDSIRSNMTIVEGDGTVTKINEPGPTLGKSELELIKESLAKLPLDGNWVVFAGRLNPGLSSDAYAYLAAVLIGLGVSSLSMAPSALAEVRGFLASVDLPTCQKAAKAALGARSAKDAELLAKEILEN